MDNKEQVKEIEKYKERLSGLLGMEIENNTAAIVWVERHAKQWRTTHPAPQPCTQS